MNGQHARRTIAVLLAAGSLGVSACDRAPTDPPAPAQTPAATPAPAPATPKPAEPKAAAPVSSDAAKPVVTPTTLPVPAPVPAAPAPGKEAVKPPAAPPEPPYTGPNKPIAPDAKPVLRTTTPSGLVLEDFAVGVGLPAVPNAMVTFKNIGRVKGSDKPFENTYETNTSVSAGLDQLMPGLQEGILGMKATGQRRIHIPSTLAFGFVGRKDPAKPGVFVVPPDSDVVFDVELMRVRWQFAAPEPAPKSEPTPVGKEPPTSSEPRP